jgi:hypothetical protein
VIKLAAKEMIIEIAAQHNFKVSLVAIEYLIPDIVLL